MPFIIMAAVVGIGTYAVYRLVTNKNDDNDGRDSEHAIDLDKEE